MAATLIGWTGYAPAAPTPISSSDGSAWDYFVTARTGAGYKDNVTLAYVAPQGSPFLDGSLDFITTRLPLDGTQINLFGYFEEHRYLCGTVKDEQIGFGQAQVTRFFGGNWRAGLGLEYLYQDQFLDVSATETNVEAVRVQGHTFIARPHVRRDLAYSCWLELQAPVQRQLLRAPLDDYWESGPQVILGHSYGHRSEMTLSYEANYRAYDQAEELSAEGEALPGTHRNWWYQKMRWTWRHYWDDRRRWRTTSKLSWKMNRDNGSGYFDYDAVEIAQQLRYRIRSWEASAEIRLSHYGYLVQTASLTNPANRTRKELLFTVRLEKTLTKFLTLFTEYEREQVWSNESVEQFHVNTVTGGVLWEF